MRDAYKWVPADVGTPVMTGDSVKDHSGFACCPAVLLPLVLMKLKLCQVQSPRTKFVCTKVEFVTLPSEALSHPMVPILPVQHQQPVWQRRVSRHLNMKLEM